MVGVVPNVHSFRNLVLDSFTVLIEDMIVPEIFLNYLGQGIQEFTKPKEVNSTFTTVLMIIHAFSKINGIFFTEPLRKIIEVGPTPPIAIGERFVSIQRPELDISVFLYSSNTYLA